MESQPNNPLHGVKLEQILIALEAHYGWEAMGKKLTSVVLQMDQP